ncbi:hypothetical protein F5Y09DRAFT_71063 [Xylaria sp. FL1042]|nr:hypothetical protein F5Y09DRAFT_71063 [Xylaria sp. FL1042]
MASQYNPQYLELLPRVRYVADELPPMAEEPPAGAFMAYWTPNSDFRQRPENAGGLHVEIREKFISMFGRDEATNVQMSPTYSLYREARFRYSRSLGFIGDYVHAAQFAGSTLLPARLVLGSSPTLNIPLANAQDLWNSNLRAGEIIRELWPDAHCRDPKRRLVGPGFEAAWLPEHVIMRWLGSLDLNEESVTLNVLERAWGELCLSPSESPRMLLPKPDSSEVVRHHSYLRPFDMASTPPPSSMLPPETAHIWAFTSQRAPWILSFPVMAAIIGLMANPCKGLRTREGQVFHNCSKDDNDICWCLDLLQSFCRTTPDSMKDFDGSFSLSIYNTNWVYLSLMVTFYDIVVNPTTNSQVSQDSEFLGLICARRRIEVPQFICSESRILVSARVGLWNRMVVSGLSGSNVGVILTDTSHLPINATARDYENRNLTSTCEIGGINFFLSLVWDQLDVWKARWTHCLDCLADCSHVAASDLVTAIGMGNAFGGAAFKPVALYKEQTWRIQALTNFRSLIAATPNSLQLMKQEWTQLCPTLNYWDEKDQSLIVENWGRLAAHAEELQESLHKRIDRMHEELKERQRQIFEIKQLS